jgi:hypothetical protein
VSVGEFEGSRHPKDIAIMLLLLVASWPSLLVKSAVYSPSSDTRIIASLISHQVLLSWIILSCLFTKFRQEIPSAYKFILCFMVRAI